MNPVAHLFFGAAFATGLIAFGVELPRRRQGLGRSTMSNLTIFLVVIIFTTLAALPQVSRYIGDRKLDTGPIFNLFLFHDVLDLAGQRFRLGNGLLDPPVTVSAVALGVSLLFLAYLRSNGLRGWHILWRDAAYFAVIILCLVAVRSAVSGNSYIYLAKTYVHIHREPFIVVGNTIFSMSWIPVVGAVRDRAMAVRDASVAVESTQWFDRPDEVGVFLNGNRQTVYPLEYDALVTMISVLRQTPDSASEEDLSRIIRAGSLPRVDIPTAAALGIPLVAFILCGALIHPSLSTDQ